MKLTHQAHPVTPEPESNKEIHLLTTKTYLDSLFNTYHEWTITEVCHTILTAR